MKVNHRKPRILPAALAALLLASCSLKPAEANSSSAAPASSAPVSSADASAPAAEGSELSAKYPLITDPNINEPGTLPVVKEKATLRLGIAQSPNVTTYAYGENWLTTYLEDLTNVHLELELFPATDAEQKLELMISSNAALPDILYGMNLSNDTVRFNYGKAGAIIPLDEYYDQLGVLFDKAANASEIYTRDEFLRYVRSPDGHIYGMTEFIVSIQNHYQHRAWINQSWLDNLGLKMPETQEEFVEVLRAFRDKDPNGNGQKDEIPMVGCDKGWNSDVVRYLMNQYTYTSYSSDFYTVKDGKLDVPYDKEEWREGLRFVRSLVDEGLISTLSFTQDSTQYNALVSADPQVVGIGVSGSIGGFGSNIKDYGALAAIKGPNGAQYATYNPAYPGISMAITRDCQNPALAFLWASVAYDYDTEIDILQRYGERDVDWSPSVADAKGLYEDMGYPALIHQINQIWGQPQKSHWSQQFMPTIGTYAGGAGQEWDGDENANEYKNAGAVKLLSDFVPDKEELFYKIIYTAEETEQTSVMRSALQTYITESMARFAIGDLDIEKDWDSYLGELEKLQYKELMEIDQAAYDRTNS